MTSPEPTITAGVDLASRANHTGFCKIEWFANSATVTSLTSSFDDDQLTDLVAGVTKLGIDVPLGWPIAFVEAVTMHSADGSWPRDYVHSHNGAYRYRQTDIWAREVLGFPALLSVSTNLISIACNASGGRIIAASKSSGVGWIWSCRRGVPRGGALPVGISISKLQREAAFERTPHAR